MCCPADGGALVLAVHAGRSTYATLPFVNVAELLATMPVPIPRIVGHDNALGILALQDLGDVTLQAHLGAEPYPSHAALYRQAVALIATLQRRGAELASPTYVPYGVAFDVEKLAWELDFFLKHFVDRLPRRVASRARTGGDSRASSGRSSRNWRASRGCCAIATTTAAT